MLDQIEVFWHIKINNVSVWAILDNVMLKWVKNQEVPQNAIVCKETVYGPEAKYYPRDSNSHYEEYKREHDDT